MCHHTLRSSGPPVRVDHPRTAVDATYSSCVITETTVNGLPALWSEGPLPYTAALVVRAGATDETVRTMGVAHLVEHLVMAAQPRTVLEVNAQVDDVLTIFHATGDPVAVAAWLGGVCATIRDLPLDRLKVEARVLDAEDGGAAHPALEWSAGARYGADGAGLLGRQGAPHGTLTRTHVVDFLHRHFVSGNAVVVSTGAPPAHSDLYLTEGPAPTRLPARPSDLPLPSYLAGPPVPVASWLGARSAVSQVLTNLVSDLLTDTLRHTEGLVYEVGGDSTPVDDTTLLVALWADGAERDQPRILTTTVDLLRQLAERGPTAEDLVHQKAVARAQLTDPRGTMDHLVLSAFRRLDGRALTTVEEETARVEAVTAEEVRQAAARALDTLLLAGTAPAPEGIAGIPDRTEDETPSGVEVEGREWKRKLVSMAPRDLRLLIGEAGVDQTALGHRHVGLWSDLRGVAKGPDFRAIVFADGGQVTVWPGSLKDGAAAVDEIDRRAGDLLFEVDENWL